MPLSHRDDGCEYVRFPAGNYGRTNQQKWADLTITYKACQMLGTCTRFRRRLSPISVVIKALQEPRYPRRGKQGSLVDGGIQGLMVWLQIQNKMCASSSSLSYISARNVDTVEMHGGRYIRVQIHLFLDIL